MNAGRVDADRAGRDQFGHHRFRMPALHLRHPGADRVARKPAADEDDEPVEPADAVAAEGKRIDLELDLLVTLYRSGHRSRLAEPGGAKNQCWTVSTT